MIAAAAPSRAKAGISKCDEISWPAMMKAGKSPKYSRATTVPVTEAIATGAKAGKAIWPMISS